MHALNKKGNRRGIPQGNVIPPGSVFGRWTVMRFHDTQNGRRYWCKCECGFEKVVHGGELRLGRSTSCGCNGSTFAHGSARRGKKTKLYNTWVMMRTRCSNPSRKEYALYGGRGITVCDRWSVFSAFAADMGEPPSPRHSIDRIDNDGNYEPENCRWALPKLQRRNSRRIVQIAVGQTAVCLTNWCKAHGITYSAAHSRLQRKYHRTSFSGKEVHHVPGVEN